MRVMLENVIYSLWNACELAILYWENYGAHQLIQSHKRWFAQYYTSVCNKTTKRYGILDFHFWTKTQFSDPFLPWSKFTAGVRRPRPGGITSHSCTSSEGSGARCGWISYGRRENAWKAMGIPGKATVNGGSMQKSTIKRRCSVPKSAVYKHPFLNIRWIRYSPTGWFPNAMLRFSEGSFCDPLLGVHCFSPYRTQHPYACGLGFVIHCVFCVDFCSVLVRFPCVLQ